MSAKNNHKDFKCLRMLKDKKDIVRNNNMKKIYVQWSVFRK